MEKLCECPYCGKLNEVGFNDACIEIVKCDCGEKFIAKITYVPQLTVHKIVSAVDSK